MIILNQKKDIAINFSNVISVYRQGKNVQVSMTFIEDALILGKYKTEERAKEVLNEIIERYTNWNNLVYGQPTGECSPKYEMPKEWLDEWSG